MSLESTAHIDSILLPFLYTNDEREAARHLEALIEHATPGIAMITRASRTPEDAFQEAAHRLVKRLRKLRAHHNTRMIGDYPHYVKVIASRVVKGQVREEHPKRRSLVNSLRHALKRELSFAFWESGGNKLCGFALWRDRCFGHVHSARLTRLLQEPRSFQDVVPLACEGSSISHLELLRLLFEWLGHPVRFKDLTRIVCGLKRIKELNPLTDGQRPQRPLSEWLPDRERHPDEHAEWKEFLCSLWNEIQQLPRSQRLAYLLNFTAADGQLELFWIHGVTSLNQIGAALQITDEQFARAWQAIDLSDKTWRQAEECHRNDDKFALLCQHLPLPDAVIAHMLGTERQKVINLRKAASERLSRHMARMSKPNHASLGR
ncbi:MAG TPA: hypothetical protein VFA65_08235 [Bryobacteraceae bacterium]|nr:hypothetical protein [Bryobacteraceae bacterium]